MKTQSREKPIIKYTPEGKRLEISPYIWGVMHGEPPFYLEEEEEARGTIPVGFVRKKDKGIKASS